MLEIIYLLNITRDERMIRAFIIICFLCFFFIIIFFINFYFIFFLLCNSVGFMNIFRVLVIEQRVEFVVISQKKAPLELCDGSINKGLLRLIKYEG